ncbi:MAG: PepSY domain-containing protein [Sphaerochaetaceae bacterium]|nr:PepSY domain-containing protein [Sphaerochaetaceae bacterium]
MKKVLSVLLVFFLALTVIFAANISEKQAKKTALENAGVKEKECTYVYVEKDYDNGRLVYEVSFYSNHTEYDYDIDGASGTILSVEKEYKGTNAAVTTVESGPVHGQDALHIALNHAKVTEEQISKTKIKSDTDDGRHIYEISFRVGKTEYEYDIDAQTGTILEFDID